jgi:hypothetical protein
MRLVALAGMTALAGCGGGATSPDASALCTARADPLQCWPDPAHKPQGAVTLGTGRAAFEAMPDTLTLEYGPQGGFDLVANVRMSGFDPGNLDVLLDPGNPRTRIRAYFADSNIPLNFFAVCPFRQAYRPSQSGDYDYEFPEGVPVIFETCWRSNHLIGARVRIELELMDDCGGYVSDVKTVTLVAPTEPYPIEDNAPGCMHVADP